MSDYEIAIVGAGHAGAQTAIALRQKNFKGSIALIGDEPELPYERPPLSKEYLAGEKTFERLLIRPENFWQEQNITIFKNKYITSVDPASKVIEDVHGERLLYDQLIWATGGTPRKLQCEGQNLQGIHFIRSRRDVDILKSDLEHSGNVVIIGGGYIGLEAAAVLTKLGKKVTLVEALPRVLARVASEPISTFFEMKHREAGVDIRLNTEIQNYIGEQDRVKGVLLKNDEFVPADLIIVGIGIIPNVKPLLDAGANGQNGVDVDQYCRTSIQDIFAVGDCAAHENIFCDGARIRLESVQNANDQAATVANVITGSPQPYNALPWFWSNQNDIKLQTAGLSTGYDDFVIRGDQTNGCFSVIYLKTGKVIALDCVNATKDYLQGRKLILNSIKPDKERLADLSVPLKEFLG